MLLDNLARRGVGTHVEPDDDRVGSLRQRGIVFRDGADARGHNGDLHLVRAELRQRVAQGLHAALYVGADQQIDVGLLFLAHAVEQVLELGGLLARQTRLAPAFLPLGGRLARLALVGDRQHLVAGPRNAGQSLYHGRHGRAGRFDRLSGLVEHRAHAAVLLAGQDHVAAVQRALLDQQGRDGAAALVQAGLHHHAARLGFGVGLQFHDLGLQQDALEQVVDPFARLGRHVDEDILPAPVLGNDFFLG